MTQTQQPEALRIADLLEQCSLNSLLSPFTEVAIEADRQHKGEPVAWVTADTVDGQTVNGKTRRIWWENNEGVGIPIYATPAAQADAKDAARYRWLRDNDWNADKELGPVIRLQLNALWDVSIDAAIATQANREGEKE